jgi:hypothetical protein
MTMNVERRAWSGWAGIADVVSRGLAGIALHWRESRKARRAAKREVDLASLSDHMRRDLGLLPKATSCHCSVRNGRY